MVSVGVGGEELVVGGRGVGELVVNGALEILEEMLDSSPVHHAWIPRKSS